MTARKPTLDDTTRTVPPTPQQNGEAGQSFVSSDLLESRRVNLFDCGLNGVIIQGFVRFNEIDLGTVRFEAKVSSYVTRKAVPSFFKVSLWILPNGSKLRKLCTRLTISLIFGWSS